MTSALETAEATEGIVIDNGSGWLKAGFARDDQPRAVFPAIIGRPRHAGVLVPMQQHPYRAAAQAQAMRGILQLSHPIEKGIITRWNDMEKLWHHTFYEELRIQPEEHSVLMTEPPRNPKTNREQMTQVLFETFNVPSFYVAVRSVLAMFANGLDTGIVVQSGESATFTVPVYEGYALQHAVCEMDIAGRDCSYYLNKLLSERGYSFTTTAEKEIVRDIKEKVGFVASDLEYELERSKYPSYELPDGQMITAGNTVFRCCEIMFNPRLYFEAMLLDLLDFEVGSNGKNDHCTVCKTKWKEKQSKDDVRSHFEERHCEDESIAVLVNESVSMCSREVRKDLLSNVVLSGGNTLFGGMSERLNKDVNCMIQGKHTVDGYLRQYSKAQLYDDVVNITYDYCGVDDYSKKYASFESATITAPPERRYSVWIGGSILSQNTSFLDQYISKKEYNEFGKGIVHRKCF